MPVQLHTALLCNSRHYGIPLTIYGDRHGVFKVNGKPRHVTQPVGPTQFTLAIGERNLCPFATGQGTSGTDGRKLRGPADHGTQAGRGGHREEVKAVLKEFLPRYNRRIRVPPICLESASRAAELGLRLEQILCSKHIRRLARDNTVKFHRNTLQTLPGPKRPSYAGAVVVVLEGLDGRLSLRPEGYIIASQEAPPSPGALRSGLGDSPIDAVGPPSLEDRYAPRDSTHTTSEPLSAEIAAATNGGRAVDDDVVEMTVSASTRKPTFLQMKRWKEVQEAKRRGLSIRGMARELGIHRHTVRRYIDAESPPTRRPPQLESDTLAE